MLHGSRFLKVFALFILHSLLCAIHSTLLSGCSSPASVIQTDKSHPSLELDGNQVRCNGITVSPYDVPKILEEHGVRHDTLIHIRVNGQQYTREAHLFRHVLARGGYSRSALVTKEHAEAWTEASRNPASPVSSPPRPRIRYRSANED